MKKMHQGEKCKEVMPEMLEFQRKKEVKRIRKVKKERNKEEIKFTINNY